MREFKPNDVNGNAHDPLQQREGQELFTQLSRVCSGFSYEDVVSAAGNLLINAVRQKCATAKDAASTYDELMAAFKGLLLDQHYFPDGKRRSVFAFHQTIVSNLFNAREGSRRR